MRLLTKIITLGQGVSISINLFACRGLFIEYRFALLEAISVLSLFFWVFLFIFIDQII